MASSSSSSSSTPWSSYFENSDEITQDGKVLIKLSDRKPLFIVPDVFREKVYINIREYYLNKRESEEEEEEEEEEEDDEEENTPYLFPTKKGVCFTEEEFEVFLNKIARVKSVVKRLKKEKTKSAENSKSADKRRSREDRQMAR